MYFEAISESGFFEIQFTGEYVDVYSLGALNLNMQDIIDKVSFWMLSQEGLLEPTWRRPKYLPRKMPSTYKRLVKADIRNINNGSLTEVFSFAVLAAIADPNVIAILQNLGANMIWAIGTSGIHRLRRRRMPDLPNIPPLRRPDPFDVGPNVRDIVMAISENSDQPSEIIFRYNSPNQESMEISIIINGEGNRRRR